MHSALRYDSNFVSLSVPVLRKKAVVLALDDRKFYMRKYSKRIFAVFYV